MKNVLYGNGINDDYPAIQEMLDSGVCEIALPVPSKRYMISKTLKIHGGQTLKLGRFTEIFLMPNSNCAMIEDDDFSNFKENICIDGGIWNMNNTNQAPNPLHFPDDTGMTFEEKRAKLGYTPDMVTELLPVYSGVCMRFCRIKNFIIKNITLKNPVNFGVQMAHIEQFTVEDIIFDYKTGAPKLWNLDGVHIEGHCRHGLVRNLKGTTHDDLLAITADDGLYGPIDNIVVDGIYADHAHSAVRILSHGVPIKNITISNIFGSYYVYCVGITKYHGGEDERGVMKNIIIKDLSVGSSQGTADVPGGVHPIIWVQKGVDVDGLTVRNIEREEYAFAVPMLMVDEGASVKRLDVSNMHQKSFIDCELPMLVLDGETEVIRQENLFSE